MDANVAASTRFRNITRGLPSHQPQRSNQPDPLFLANNNASPKEGAQWRKRGYGGEQCNGNGGLCGVDVGLCSGGGGGGGSDGEDGGGGAADGSAASGPDKLEGPGAAEEDTLHLKRRVGLISGVALIVGTMIGNYGASGK